MQKIKTGKFYKLFFKTTDTRNMISNICNTIFEKAIEDYHKTDSVDTEPQNPYKQGTFEFTLYQKSWIDTVQWHLEDIIRNPDIDPVSALQIKRRIDASNQLRTDIVEELDTYFLQKFNQQKPQEGATSNTESPAWAIDRLAILALKIYHMRIETERKESGPEHRKKCIEKLELLEQQKLDLSTAIDELINEIEKGKKIMRVYRQMKMYNDPTLNPVLYARKN